MPEGEFVILFRYSKRDGAEFISHLDLLRHIDRTLRRAHIAVKKSEAVNRHPRIYLSAPVGVGVVSNAEYCLIDAEFEGDFQAAFNAHAPLGVRCLAWTRTDKKVNVAGDVTACEYRVEGLAPFDAAAILSMRELVLTDKRGRTKDVRPSVLGLEVREDGVWMKLSAGETTLRPDVLGEYLAARFGGSVAFVEKTAAFGLEAYGV